MSDSSPGEDCFREDSRIVFRDGFADCFSRQILSLIGEDCFSRQILSYCVFLSFTCLRLVVWLGWLAMFFPSPAAGREGVVIDGPGAGR